jgi:GPH family glycoside/pentoside/hexuronide:cation symporter
MPIQKLSLMTYAILAMPLTFAGIPIYIHAPDFYVTTYGVSLTILGTVMMLLRLFDAVQDPLIGYLSDKYAHRRPIFMLLGATLLVISFTFLFMPLTDHYVLWFAAFLLLSTSAFSLLTINLNAIGGLWSHDPHQKTVIASYREFFGLLGLLLAVILPGVLQQFMPKESAFEIVSFTLLLIMIVAFSLFWKFLSKHVNLNKPDKSSGVHLPRFKDFSKKLRKFFIIYTVSMFASSIPAGLVLFFIRDRLDLESYTGLFLFAYFVAGALGVPLWQYVSSKVGKYQAWLLAMFLAVVSFIWAFSLDEKDLFQYVLICIFSGVAFGAELIFPASILADHVHDDKKEKQASLYYGLLAFLAKSTFAISVALCFIVLDFVKFEAAAENSVYALNALSLLYAAVPCFIKIISIYLLWRFINEENETHNHRSRHHA